MENFNVQENNQENPVIYVGPNIFTLAMQKFQVFTNGIPVYVQRAIEKIPEIKKLIIPVEELEKMRARIAKAGTKEARIFYKVQKEAEKLRDKK